MEEKEQKPDPWEGIVKLIQQAAGSAPLFLTHGGVYSVPKRRNPPRRKKIK